MPNKEEIINQLGQDILAYVMSGSRAETEIARRIKPEQLDDRFVDYQLLLDLHFILRPKVVKFVKKLPQRLRSIKTSTKINTKVRHGGIEGRINWGSTIKRRYSQNPQDRSIFVCDNKTVNYDIPENIVLKHLISIIHECLQNAKEYLKNDYTWNEEAWRVEEQLIDDLERIVERNIHVDRIRSPDHYEPTERMLISAESSRQPLYFDAAELVNKRRDIQEGDADEIEDLLENTAITPDDDSTLFELYVFFRFVSVLEGLRSDQVSLETIESDKNEIARFDGDPPMVLYHDNSPRDRGVSFNVDDSFDELDELSRSDRVMKGAKELSDNFFAEGDSSYTGRPDVTVLEIRNEERNEYEYLITEVKDSTNKSTIKKGIRDTLEYLAFLQIEDPDDDENEEYIHNNTESEIFGSNCKGLLVTQDLDRETQSYEEQSSKMKVIQASELQEKLPKIINEAFGSFS